MKFISSTGGAENFFANVSTGYAQGMYYLPCFPENKTGLILIFTPKYGTRAYFRGCIILIYQKMKLQSKNYEILNKQKLRKKIYIYLPLTCFLFRNSLTTIYSRFKNLFKKIF